MIMSIIKKIFYSSPLPSLFLAILAIAALFTVSAHAGTIYYAKVEGIINPVVAEFITKSIKSAEDDHAEALIIQLDTPGGLDLSMRDIVKAMLASEVPTVVYVAPPGSRAASAGVFITYAADIAAMAPGTNIGSAHPVEMSGQKMDETMAKKVENDAAAYIKGIAHRRKRNPEWAERAVRLSVNITAEEALKLRVIDILAENSAGLIKSLDGRKVELTTGERVLKTSGAQIKDIEMNLRARILNAISNPTVAYILMMIGLVGLYFELSNPGSILPGVVGAVCLVLAFYAFQTLPINYAGLLLIALAIIFFIAEVKVVSYGLLAVAWIVSLILGSMMLFDTPLPFMKVSIWVILPTVILMSAAIFGTMYYAVVIHRKKPVSGAEGLVGQQGTAIEDIDTGGTGRVFVDGEYWNAQSAEPVKKGERVKVIEVKGLLLKVIKTE